MDESLLDRRLFVASERIQAVFVANHDLSNSTEALPGSMMLSDDILKPKTKRLIQRFHSTIAILQLRRAVERLTYVEMA